MQFKIQLTIINPENGKENTKEIISLNKQSDRLEDIGLSLAESKSILKALQEKITEYQCDDFVESNRACGACDKIYRKKGNYPIVLRTLFGDLSISSPRFYTCGCKEREHKTFSPLTGLLTEHTSPERLYLETKWSSILPFGKTVDLLKDVLPVSGTINKASVRNHLIKVAEREEAELGKEQFMFIEGCQRERDQLPRPEGTIVVGLDGGYLRSWKNKNVHFEVIAGKSLPTDRSDKFFAFVETYGPAKPKPGLFETLKSQGMQFNQSLEFLSDGATNLQELQKYLSPLSGHYLDWFHITMKITVLKQYLKGMVKTDEENGEQFQEYLEKIKWYLWHGNTYKALTYLERFDDEVHLTENGYEHLGGFKKHVADFAAYIRNNEPLIINYGERCRNGEIYTSSFAESTINEVVARRFCKKQQMQWTKKGAHSMLSARTKVLNGELGDCFKKWYPNIKIEKNYNEAA